MNKIKIVSDGTPIGTRVFCGDEEIKGVISIQFEIKDNRTLARATLTVENVALEVTDLVYWGEAEIR